jgi:hypothetical protein
MIPTVSLFENPAVQIVCVLLALLFIRRQWDALRDERARRAGAAASDRVEQARRRALR